MAIKPIFLATMGYPIFLTMVFRARAPLARAELRYYINHNNHNITLTDTKRQRPDSLEEENPFLSMAKEEHNFKMKVLKLKEWMLMHQCNNMGIGLPPAYDTDKEDS